MLTGLTGVAITQPMFDMFGSNPTFFVAGHYSRTHIVLFALGVALVPPLLVLATTTLAGLAGPRARTIAHGLAVAALAGLFALAVCRTVGVDRVLGNALVALPVGLAVALLEHRLRPVRQFLGYLTAGNVVFLVMFLAASPTAALLGADGATVEGVVDVPPLDGPVIVVVMDELPVTSLLEADGTINEQRYPNFARLAERASWFRDAAAESSHTYVSVPTILTGLLSTDDQIPTRSDHPRNLFTLLGDRYPVHAYEPITSLCPESACPPPNRGSLGQMFGDASIVYRHRVLPAAFRERLPSISQSWGRFGDGWGVQAAVTESGGLNMAGKVDDVGSEGFGPLPQLSAFRREVAEIDGEPSLTVLHVVFPHRPYLVAPSGAPLADTWLPADITVAPDEPGHAAVQRDVTALQAMQFAAADQVIGDLIDRLESTGAWDDTMLVVTSDHGTEIMAPSEGRPVTEDNQDEVLRIPLFVKVPGQARGETRDEPASTLDVVPTIVDALGVETDWSFDGHSLLDGSVPHTPRRLTTGSDGAVAVATRHQRQFPGPDWTALARTGVAAELVGTEVTHHTVGTPSSLGWSHGYGDLLTEVSVEQGPLPLLLKAEISGAARSASPELAVSVNGTIAGTLAGYQWADGTWHASGILAQHFVDGSNELAAYEVERSADGVVLHPVPGA